MTKREMYHSKRVEKIDNGYVTHTHISDGGLPIHQSSVFSTDQPPEFMSKDLRTLATGIPDREPDAKNGLLRAMQHIGEP